MNVLIDIGHPGHVHLFRNLYFRLVHKGHNVLVVTQDINSAKTLLEAFKIPYSAVGIKRNGIIGKGLAMFRNTMILLSFARKNKIDFCISSTPSLMQVSALLGIPSIFMDDDDDPVEPLVCHFAHPFSSVILSPESTIRKTSKNIYYQGYHELAYLHPSVFEPDEKILDKINVKEGEPFFIIRFVALKGHHDRNAFGLSGEQKQIIIKELSKYGKVFITSEKEMDDWFKPYQLKIPFQEIHSLLYYASLFVGDSQTMTSEAAILGTPAIRCNTFVNQITYLNEEEEKYDLTYGFHPDDFDNFLNKVIELASNPEIKNIWGEKRKKLLSDKINVTSFLVWFIENYPESKDEMKKNPDYQYTFI